MFYCFKCVLSMAGFGPCLWPVKIMFKGSLCDNLVLHNSGLDPAVGKHVFLINISTVSDLYNLQELYTHKEHKEIEYFVRTEVLHTRCKI